MSEIQVKRENDDAMILINLGQITMNDHEINKSDENSFWKQWPQNLVEQNICRELNVHEQIVHYLTLGLT